MIIFLFHIYLAWTEHIWNHLWPKCDGLNSAIYWVHSSEIQVWEVLEKSRIKELVYYETFNICYNRLTTHWFNLLSKYRSNWICWRAQIWAVSAIFPGEGVGLLLCASPTNGIRVDSWLVGPQFAPVFDKCLKEAIWWSTQLPGDGCCDVATQAWWQTS